MKLKFKKLTATATLPTYGTDGAAGMDIYADENITIRGCAMPVLVHTGIAVAIPKGYVGLLVPRSGLSLRSRLRQPNCVGVIDSDYRGEIRGMFENTGLGFPEFDIEIHRGDRFAQMLIVPCEKCEIEEVEDLDETARGKGGFGSTGINDADHTKKEYNDARQQ